MSVLRTIAVILFIVGLLGFIIPGIPAADFIKWAILIAIILFVVDLLTGGRRAAI